jgi:hypothetical protein
MGWNWKQKGKYQSKKIKARKKKTAVAWANFGSPNQLLQQPWRQGICRKRKKPKNKDLSTKKLIHMLLRLEKNPDLEEKGGTTNWRQLMKLMGKPGKKKTWVKAAVADLKRWEKNYLILFGLSGFFEKVFFIPF